MVKVRNKTGEAQPPLTAPGWPRPIVDGWPVPWVSPPHNLSQMDAARKVALLDTRMCQVCGLCHSSGDAVFVCVDTVVDESGVPTNRPEDAVAVVPMDEGLLHERCLRLAVGRCPQLVELRKMSSLLVLRVPVDDVFVLDGEQHVRLDCAEVVDLGVYNRPTSG